MVGTERLLIVPLVRLVVNTKLSCTVRVPPVKLHVLELAVQPAESAAPIRLMVFTLPITVTPKGFVKPVKVLPVSAGPVLIVVANPAVGKARAKSVNKITRLIFASLIFICLNAWRGTNGKGSSRLLAKCKWLETSAQMVMEFFASAGGRSSTFFRKIRLHSLHLSYQSSLALVILKSKDLTAIALAFPLLVSKGLHSLCTR
jgi:hypothetical protein